MQKAKEISKRLGQPNLRPLKVGFIDETKYALTFVELHGEASEANTEAAVELTSKGTLDLLKRYEPANIYNADETALPDSTYVAKSTRKDVIGYGTGMLQHEWRQTLFTHRFVSKPTML